MLHLHQVIHQLVTNPDMLAEVIQQSHLVADRFGLAPNETQALIAVFQDGASVQKLLSADALRNLVEAADGVELWVPPAAPT